MIQKEKLPRGSINKEFIKLSITGKIDDILQQKTQIDLKNIFSDCKGKRKLVLIEGAPGSGKSTLALHICQEWAEGKLFQDYSIVILVRLRDPLIIRAKTVADLLPRVNKTMADETEATITSVYGEGVLWVLDGWDELPSDLPSDSIINKLIQPGIFLESPLPKSSVIVTSRPSSSAELHSLMSSRVEVLGFTPHELEQYFRELLKGDSGAVQTLLERIRENPVVEGSCYLPLNAAIVAHVFLSGDHSLPTSNHGIFTAVVQSSLKRYLQDKLGKTIPVGDIKSLDTLPLEIQVPFSHLCQLAFYGTQSNKVTFCDSDLTALSIPKNMSFSEIGLLQSVPSIVSDGHRTYFCFLHLSIQELLAAVHISHMSPKQQIAVFQELFDTPRFSAVFQFYAGITKLRTNRPWLSKLPRFLCPVPASVYDLVRNVVRKVDILSTLSSLPVSLLHCLYEAEDPSLCVFVADLLGHTLSLKDTTLSPLDCLSVGYFLSVVSTTVSAEFTVGLVRCSIGDQGCRFLVRGLCKCLNTHSKITSPLCVLLWNNGIHEEGMSHILENTSVVYKLVVGHNSIGEDGLKSLIATGLSNKKLRKLYLYKCDLTDKSMEDLSAGLNNYVERLNIVGNDSITENGLKILARRLTTLSGIRYMGIPKHLKSSINSVFSEVNEERRRNGLPEIEVATGECE